MSDTKAAKDELLRDIDRVLVNIQGLSYKKLPKDKRDDVIWTMKILKVARKVINEF